MRNNLAIDIALEKYLYSEFLEKYNLFSCKMQLCYNKFSVYNYRCANNRSTPLSGTIYICSKWSRLVTYSFGKIFSPESQIDFMNSVMERPF